MAFFRQKIGLLLPILLFLGCVSAPRFRHSSGSGPEKVHSDSRPGPSAQAGAGETGEASYYAHDFNGKKTANGEIYDMHAMTAAHPTLPFNTRLQVENLDNGKSAVVRVNDRGPFARGRIVDLSLEAAKRLGMIGPGKARVKLTVQP